MMMPAARPCSCSRRALSLGVVALYLAGILTAHAAITVDSVASQVSSGNVLSLSWSHTVGSVTNRILIVGVSFVNGNVAANTVTYGGTALTRIGFIAASGTTDRTELWYLIAPAIGTATVVVTASASRRIAAGSISFAGVHQSTPLGTFASATATSATATVNVSSASGQLVVDTVTTQGNANSLTVGAGQTQQWNIVTGTNVAAEARSGGSTEAGAATVTMSWTLGVSRAWSIGAVPLLPAVLPLFVNLKTVSITSDPINGSTNPKYIPGAYALYAVRITNTAAASPDNNSVAIAEPVPANTTLFVGDLGGAGSGPVTFTNGSPSSGLTYTFTSLASTTDSLSFSNNSGATYAYTPIPDVNGFDVNVTNIRVSPSGVFAAAGAGNPYFQIGFRVKVK